LSRPEVNAFFSKKVNFLSGELLPPCPTPTGGPPPPPIGCLTAYSIYSQLPAILEAFLHLQPEDVPCHGNRDPFIIGLTTYDHLNEKLAFNPY